MEDNILDLVRAQNETVLSHFRENMDIEALAQALSESDITVPRNEFVRQLSNSRYEVMQLGALCDVRYALDPLVRKVQLHLAQGGTHHEAQVQFEIDNETMELISKYLRYRERHIYDDSIEEFDSWKSHQLSLQ